MILLFCLKSLLVHICFVMYFTVSFTTVSDETKLALSIIAINVYFRIGLLYSTFTILLLVYLYLLSLSKLSYISPATIGFIVAYRNLIIIINRIIIGNPTVIIGYPIFSLL